MRVLSVALCAVFLLVLWRFWDLPPVYEAASVVQIRPGGDSIPLIESRLLTRDMLETTAARHGVGSVVVLSQAIALHPLTSRAGESMGLPLRDIGLIISVRLGDASQAVRVANDVALQVMDLAEAGQIDAGAERLSLMRSEEYRLWQEVSALRSVPDLDAAGARQLVLLEAEHAEIVQSLAQQEVRARVEGRLKAPPYAILARAHEAQTIVPPLREALTALAAAALALALLSALIGREIRVPSPSAPSADSARSRSS
ncbi:hypothetical protein [Stagnihabitans tardus]|uniref:Polysaccharide chain length determinant N-terminal domain-containing protein n=1 Tax=Stagnihabitans tardus TaxID=2699202 RepID=A0AAE5BWR5_9RHOB|nr:hypothetical protein [Stagnihabitans tardus]NBZ89059.1 hypothetical protein [Stagnihabitans tardus]